MFGTRIAPLPAVQDEQPLASDRCGVSGVAQATPVTCSPFDRLGEAAARLVDSGGSFALVTAGDGSDRPIGWLSARDVVCAAARDPAALAELRVRSAMTGCVSCPDDAPALDVLRRMQEGATDRIVLVSRAGRLRGVVSVGDLARLASLSGVEAAGHLGERICELLAERSRGRGGSLADEVRDVMTPDPTACRSDETLSRALQLFYEGDVPCLPVLRPDGRLAGMLGARDLCRALVAPAAPRLCALVREKVASCWPDDSLEAAEAIMRAYRVRRLPVVGWQGRLEGVLSLSDVARAIVAETGSEFPRGRAIDLVETLATEASE